MMECWENRISRRSSKNLSLVISEKIYGLPEKCRSILTNDYWL